MNTIVQCLEDEGWHVLEYPIDTIKRSESVEYGQSCVLIYYNFRYRNLMQGLRIDQLLVDKDIPNLLVFSIDTDLHNHWTVVDGHLVLQDKVLVMHSSIIRRHKLRLGLISTVKQIWVSK